MKRSILCEKCSAKRLTYTLEDKELIALAEWAIEAKEMLDFYADFLERHNFGCKENVFELREIVSNYPQFPKDGEK